MQRSVLGVGIRGGSRVVTIIRCRVIGDRRKRKGEGNVVASMSLRKIGVTGDQKETEGDGFLSESLILMGTGVVVEEKVLVKLATTWRICRWTNRAGSLLGTITNSGMAHPTEMTHGWLSINRTTMSTRECPAQGHEGIAKPHSNQPMPNVTGNKQDWAAGIVSSSLGQTKGCILGRDDAREDNILVPTSMRRGGG
jgi:hypothetical protein